MVYGEELHYQRNVYTKRYKVKMVDMSFLGNPTFPPPKECTGKAEQFEGFSYRLLAYTNLINPGHIRISTQIEDDPTKVIQDDELLELQQVLAEDGTFTQVVINGISDTERFDYVMYMRRKHSHTKEHYNERLWKLENNV